MSEENMEKLRQSLIGAKRDEGIEATQALLEEGADPVIILQDAMATAMFTLGAMWSRGEVFLPEVVASATLFKMCNDLVEPALLAAGGKKQITGKVILCTVKGDLHDLGKNMVGAMLKTAGFEVTDLGKDTPRTRSSPPCASCSPTSSVCRPCSPPPSPAEGRDRGPQEGGPVRLDQGHGGWRARHAGMGDRDRRRRLRARRARGREPREDPVGDRGGGVAAASRSSR